MLLALVTIVCAAGVAWANGANDVTTHVATGAIVGAGLGSGGRAVRWNTVSSMAAAWVITLPASAVVSATVWWLGTRISGP